MNYAKFICTAPIGHASQSNPYCLPNLKHWDLQGDLLVNVHTSVHAYGERSNFPLTVQILVSNRSQANAIPFTVHGLGGVVGIILIGA